MNRREFLTAAGSVGAGIVMSGNSAFAKTTTTALYVKGLVIVDIDDANNLRLGFPKAPGHKATLAVTPQNGNVLTMTIRGNGSVTAKAMASAKPKIAIPEIVRLEESTVMQSSRKSTIARVLFQFHIALSHRSRRTRSALPDTRSCARIPARK